MRNSNRLSAPFALAASALLVTSVSTATDPLPGNAHTPFDLQIAISAAAVGDTIHVPAGSYPAPINVDRPLTLIADGDVIIDGGGQGDVLHIDAADVTLRGFTLRGSGDSLDKENAGLFIRGERARVEGNHLEDVLLGIVLHSAHESVVTNNSITGKALGLGRRGDGIRLWNSNHVLLDGNVVSGVRDCVVWYSAGTRILRNRVTDSRYGFHFMYANDSDVESNTFSDNSVGVFLMYSKNIMLRRNTLSSNRGPSGYGLGLKDMDDVVVEENVIAGNRTGIFFDNSPLRMDSWGSVRRNVIAYNDIGCAFQPSTKRNRIYENQFVENIEQVAILGTGDFKGNEFTVNGRGNYWSDYSGFDAAGDGVGDVSYRAMSLFENMMDREPKLRLFLYSPAQQAIEFASRAFPIVQPTPKVTDDAPLMHTFDIGVRATAVATPWSMSGVAGVMLGVAALVWRGMRSPRLTTRAPKAAQETHVMAPRATVARDSLTSAASAATTPLLRIRGLRKSFGRHAVVDGFDLDVAPGQAVALWGINGAGKTTIIKCLLGLYASDGEIRVGESDAHRCGKAVRRQIGYVSQELAFYDDMTALDVAELFARLKKVSTPRAAQVIAQVGLAEHAWKRVAALSGGMKQRLALAVALLSDPPLLLLDEPTSNLDTTARQTFLALLLDLKRAGKTILFTTHRPEEVVQLADRLIILERGRVKFDGEPARLGRSIVASATLRLHIASSQRESAVAILRGAGLDVRSSQHDTLLVRVFAARKAVPIDLLVRAGITVDNFDLESEDGHAD